MRVRVVGGVRWLPKVSGKHKLATGFYANLSIMHEPRLAALMRFPTLTHTLTHTRAHSHTNTHVAGGSMNNF